MAEPKENLQMEKIVSLCKRRGFVFQSSEIYGGINGFWDYGPLGAELKRNVKELWWNTMTRQREDVAGLEATIIMSPQIWKASGHVDTFADLMVECPITNKRFRADQIEPQSGDVFWFKKAYSSFFSDEFFANLGYLITFYVDQDGLNLGTRRATGEPDLKIVNDAIASLNEKLNLNIETPADNVESKFNFANSVSLQLANELKEEDAKRAKNLLNRFQQVNYAANFAVLIPAGASSEKAIKIAKEFYKKLGAVMPEPVFDRKETVKDSQHFNPENGSLLTAPRPFNLMFKTFVGPVESEDNTAYLRPETAQAIFAQFKNVMVTSRQQIPFGIAQVGKAFRNEVTPRNFTFRSREFEQMELEFFIKPDEVVEAIHGSVATVPAAGHPGEPQPNWGWQAWHQYWVEERVRFYEGIGLDRSMLGFHRQTPEELAHYARACVDILYKFPFSKKDEQGQVAGDELEGIAARSDFDLSQHQRFSGQPMGVFDEELRAAWGKLPKEKQDALWKRYYDHRKNYLLKSGVEAEPASRMATEDANGLAKGQYLPHVIEPSAGVDRLILALLANAYSEISSTDEKGKTETRVMMRFHPRVAPVKAGVFPLLKNKPELVKKALEVRDLLRPWLNVFYDEAGAIGRRYARQDEAGTPFCVTIDFDTLGEKPELLDTVTIRYRDDGKQERVKISELLAFLLSKTR